MPTLQTKVALAVAARIRGLLAEKGITQAQVATHLRLSQTAVSRRLRGETPFDINELASMADLIGVQPSSFLEA